MSSGDKYAAPPEGSEAKAYASNSGPKPSPLAPLCAAMAPMLEKVRVLMGGGSRVADISHDPRPKRRAGDGGGPSKDYETWRALLSGHQVIEIREAFNKFDRDGSGFMCAPAHSSEPPQTCPSRETSRRRSHGQ